MGCGRCQIEHRGQEYLGDQQQALTAAIDAAPRIMDGIRGHALPFAGERRMSGTDLSRELGNVNGGLPFTVLIGPDGQVRKTYLGRLKFDQLRADLAKL